MYTHKSRPRSSRSSRSTFPVVLVLVVLVLVVTSALVFLPVFLQWYARFMVLVSVFN